MKKRCECELFIEKYYGLKPDCNPSGEIKTTYSDLVNLLAMFRDDIKNNQLKFYIKNHLTDKGL